jgi:molecular chaperone GrpE
MKMSKEKKEDSSKKEEEYQKKIDELTDDLQRLQAEFENFRKRCDKETVDFRKYSESRVLGEILPIIDSFDIAMKENNHNDEFSKGIKLIHKQIHDFLKNRGLKPIICVGQTFDPFYHEVMLSVDGEEEGIVLEELQKGYMLNEKILRHSKVKVSKKKSDDNKNNK